MTFWLNKHKNLYFFLHHFLVNQAHAKKLIFFSIISLHFTSLFLPRRKCQTNRANCDAWIYRAPPAEVNRQACSNQEPEISLTQDNQQKKASHQKEMEEWWKTMPKIELHAHLNGSIRDSTLLYAPFLSLRMLQFSGCWFLDFDCLMIIKVKGHLGFAY